MNVIWITNITFPEANQLLEGQGSIKSSGGWMISAAEVLARQPDVNLTVASVSRKVKKLTRLQGKNIVYYLLPYGNGNIRVNHEYEPLWRKIHDLVHPDVIHIHGTEFSHGLAYIEACGANHVCLSIQGLMTACSDYYYCGLTYSEMLQASTPVSILRGGILNDYREFKKRGEIEKAIIRRVHHIIGRTSWDHDRIWAINPDAEYYHNNETLRADFYTGQTWSYDNCVPHSIFLSQASYPLKGLHQVLRALPLVLRFFPDTTVRIAGENICRTNSRLGFLFLSNYGNVIRRMIKKHKLNLSVSFVGSLTGEEMRQEYLRSNVFICPSSIENSPNSLGEAQILGVPVIASYVGGIPDMMMGDDDHMYRFEEVEMLAHTIVKLFNGELSLKTESMRNIALERHNPIKNMRELIAIYNIVLK